MKVSKQNYKSVHDQERADINMILHGQDFSSAVNADAVSQRSLQKGMADYTATTDVRRKKKNVRRDICVII